MNTFDYGSDRSLTLLPKQFAIAHKFAYWVERMERPVDGTVRERDEEVLIGYSRDDHGNVRTWSVSTDIRFNGWSSPTTMVIDGRLIDPRSVRHCHHTLTASRRFVGPITRWRWSRLLKRYYR